MEINLLFIFISFKEVNDDNDVIEFAKPLKNNNNFNDESLSKKFGFLSTFQVLIALSIVIYTAMYLIGLPDSMKIADRMNNYTLVIISTVSFLLFLFNSVCIYSIVNFLFKLDKSKSDKSSSTN